MKQIIKDTIEQIKSPEKEEQETLGLKEQADLGEMLKKGWKQILGGTEGAKKFPTTQDLTKGKTEDQKNVDQQIGEIKKGLAQEKPQQPKPKANLPVITPVRQPQTPEPPPYIRGKPEYSPDQKNPAQTGAGQNQLPTLVVPKSKARRGSFTDYLERKQKGPEIKGGPSG